MAAATIIFLISYLCIYSNADTSTTNFYTDLLITEANRQINLQSHIEETNTQFTIQNIGSSPQDSVLFAFFKNKTSHIAYVQALTSEGRALPTDVTSVIGVSAPEGSVFYKAVLGSPLKPKDTVTLTLVTAYSHVLIPLPAAIPQGESQYVQFFDSSVIFSPYKIRSQTTKVKLSSKNIKSHSKKDAKVNGELITYGPFSDTPAFALQSIRIHFENNNPFVTMKTCVKEIEISHWGNVAIEETYLLYHSGARLAGGFSRVDYEKSAQHRTGSFHQIDAYLPRGAHDVYYRDVIGNISSSHVRKTKDGVLLQIEPRFPMWGGWKADFYMGYNVYSKNYLSIDKDTGKYVLNISLGSPFPVAAIDDFEARIVLPEGSSDIEWTTSFSVDSQEWDTRFTYLDLIGRPVIVLRKTNVVKFHAQPVVVTYRFPAVMLFWEPFLLFLVFALFFATVIVGFRLDLSITDGKRSHSAANVSVSASASVSASVSGAGDHIHHTSVKYLAKTLHSLNSELQTLYSAKDQQKLESVSDNWSKALNTIRKESEDLESLVKQLEEVHLKLQKKPSPKLTKQAAEIIEKIDSSIQ